MSRTFGTTEKARFLKSLAYLVHRKRPVVDALTECMEMEGRGGKHKHFRAATIALESDGPVAALRAAEVLSDDLCAVFEVILQNGDHRLISDAMTALANHMENQSL